MNKADAIWAIEDRVNGIYSDLRAFVYIRIHSLQASSEGIGGGNMTQAMTLFSVLNFLGKIQYYLDKKPNIVSDEQGEPRIVEEVAFIHLVRKLHESGIALGLPEDKPDTLKLVWSGFRNKLAHVSNVEFGKQVLAYVINDPSNTLTISQFLAKIEPDEAFEHDGNHRNWKVNADTLLAKLPSIQKVITDQIHEQDQQIDYEVLMKIIG